MPRNHSKKPLFFAAAAFRKLLARWSRIAWAALFLAVVAGAPAAAQAAAMANGGDGAAKKVYLVVADKLPLRLLKDAAEAPGGGRPALEKALREGALGLMTTRGESLSNRTGSFATLGAGRPVVARPEGSLAFGCPLDEEALKAAARAALKPDGACGPDGSIVNLGAANRDRAKEPVGALGSLLRESGVAVYAFGASDLAGAFHREFTLIGVDEDGRADGGDLESFLDRPFDADGATLPDALVRAAGSVPAGRAALVLLAFPDFAHNQALESYLENAEAVERREQAALDGLNGLLDGLLGLMGPADSLILLSPTPEGLDEPVGSALLAPVLLYGPNHGSGVVRTASVKRTGLMSNVDLLPAVAEMFGVPLSAALEGSPVRVKPKARPMAFVWRQHTKLLFLKSDRSIVVRRLILLNAALLAAVAAVFWRNRPLPHKTARALAVAARLMAGVLLYFILMGAVGPGSFAQFFLWGCAFLIAFYLAVEALPGPGARAAAIAAAFVLVLAVDQLAGQPLSKNSLLSYLPQYGGRYYGIGNEFSGIWLGCCLMALGFAAPAAARLRSIGPLLAAAACGCIVVIIGHPAFGSNLGGSVAALIGLGAGLLFVFRGRLPGGAMGLAAVMAVYLAVFAGGVATARRAPVQQSHLTRMAAAVQEEAGLSPAIEAARRKAAVNWRLIKTTRWTILAALAALVAALSLRMLKDDGAQTHMKAALQAVFIAAAVNLAANDSGIVAAAYTLLMPAWLAAMTILEENIEY